MEENIHDFGNSLKKGGGGVNCFRRGDDDAVVPSNIFTAMGLFLRRKV